MRSILHIVVCECCALTVSLTLLGCAGSLQIPINERSHLQFDANPLGQNLEFSYRRYEKPQAPSKTWDRNWKHSIEIEGLGALYVSNQPGSPAGDKVERAIEKLWQEGRPTGSSVYNLVMEEVLYVDQPASAAHARKTRQRAATPARSQLPLAELPLFLFSSRPSW